MSWTVPLLSVAASSSSRFVHQVLFGRRHLLLTNLTISAGMGALGDSVVQSYERLLAPEDTEKGHSGPEVEGPAATEEDPRSEPKSYQLTRTLHMTAAGLSTGFTTHYWYLGLERLLGSRRTATVLLRKILLDQVLFSPLNLLVYFGTLGLCERSTWATIRGELLEKGLGDIYLVEWAVWPPAQLINFALLPLRYRILFDNVVSFGFDVYSPYVKYEKGKV